LRRYRSASRMLPLRRARVDQALGRRRRAGLHSAGHASGAAPGEHVNGDRIIIPPIPALKVQQITHSTYTEATINPALLSRSTAEPYVYAAPAADAATDSIPPVVSPGFRLDGAPVLQASEHVVEFPSLACPSCGSTHIRRANRTTVIDHVVRLIGLAPYRCRCCRCKFHRSHAHAAPNCPIN
jgi:hypothetical protein